MPGGTCVYVSDTGEVCGGVKHSARQGVVLCDKHSKAWRLIENGAGWRQGRVGELIPLTEFRRRCGLVTVPSSAAKRSAPLFGIGARVSCLFDGVLYHGVVLSFEESVYTVVFDDGTCYDDLEESELAASSADASAAAPINAFPAAACAAATSSEQPYHTLPPSSALSTALYSALSTALYTASSQLPLHSPLPHPPNNSTSPSPPPQLSPLPYS